MIFADLLLHRSDDVPRLTSLGLQIASKTQNRGRPTKVKLLQPCAAFDGCRCRIYEERPAYCRKFECALLTQVKSGRLRAAAALKTIEVALNKADRRDAHG